jgi:hypothetical protein
MLLRYFALDTAGQLHRIPQRRAEAVFAGERSAEDLDVDLAGELPLITVLLSEDLAPVGIYFLRLGLESGLVPSEERMEAARAISELAAPFRSKRTDQRLLKNPLITRHVRGWPEDTLQQLAQALDTPGKFLPRVYGVGGPLAIALAMGTGVKYALERWIGPALEDPDFE